MYFLMGFIDFIVLEGIHGRRRWWGDGKQKKVAMKV